MILKKQFKKNPVIITVTLYRGILKEDALSNVKQQKSGGKGKSGITTRDEDSVVQTLSVNTHTSVLFFQQKVLCIKLKLGRYQRALLHQRVNLYLIFYHLKNHQSISSIMPFPEDENDWKNLQIVFATAQGKVRKNNLEDFSSINAGW